MMRRILTKVLRERAAPTGKVCRCWMASSRLAARCFAVSPCDSALPPHYSSRSVSGTGHDKSSDPQAYPRQLIRLIGDADPARARRAFDAMMQMKRIDIAALVYWL
jgi:hypothetical protein